jgi:demethylphylloquinone reductase
MSSINSRSRLAVSSALQSPVPDSCLLNSKDHTICVVGGGFGGLYTALRLSKTLDSRTALYLIDPKDRFVFLPLLYELSMHSATLSEVAPRYEDLLRGTSINFIRGTVQHVDFARRLCDVALANEETSTSTLTLRYDQLVIAAGTQPRLDLIPGAREYSLPFYRIQDADRLHERLSQLKTSTDGHLVRVTVIGAGFSGIEIATNVAQYLGRDRGRVTVINRNDKVLPTSPQHNRDTAIHSLNTFDVQVFHNTAVKSVHADGLYVQDNTGEHFIESELIIFTAGMEQSDFIKALPLAKDKYGRLSSRKTLQTVDYDEVFAVGDCCGVDGESWPSTGQVAMQQSATVAVNANKVRVAQTHQRLKLPTKANINSNESTPVTLDEFHFMSLGEMLSLGDMDATITSMGGLVEWSGPLAAMGRRLVYAARMPTNSQAVKALFGATTTSVGKLMRRWFGGGEETTKHKL